LQECARIAGEIASVTQPVNRSPRAVGAEQHRVDVIDFVSIGLAFSDPEYARDDAVVVNWERDSGGGRLFTETMVTGNT
jgi:hypothetical protein